MKKLTFILIACSASHFSGSAQSSRFAFTAGASLANYKYKSDGASMNEKSKIGITAGILADIPINNEFSFQPAVNYVQKGTKSEYTDYGATQKSSMTVNCIEVPLNFLFNAAGKSGKFFAGAGPSITYSISAKEKYDDGTNSTSDNLKIGNNVDDDIKGMDLGANFLTGYCFNSGILISLNYNAGLSNLVPGDSGGFSAKSNYFGLRLGYFLKSAAKK